jgi:hypothetical protein
MTEKQTATPDGHGKIYSMVCWKRKIRRMGLKAVQESVTPGADQNLEPVAESEAEAAHLMGIHDHPRRYSSQDGQYLVVRNKRAVALGVPKLAAVVGNQSSTHRWGTYRLIPLGVAGNSVRRETAVDS